ncbi:hypothetical protein GCM10023172_13170 [Hymenobacter ginsengisoli]|uniref:IPT/TIG domain-containing protein n=1 Tax=Hymenobacter ginsengisoli TaxID=1051626 RepID=A0ABP8Q7T1_9BACT|nr:MULTISPECIES: IPT/TIG domain-containing protein [unclassified Hymenobacter]MBO2031904.1 T9SS type A sorting domain-containing protein [Hymenobacter sp. BT559]
MLAPVPLSQRSQQATLVVEARVASQQVADLGGHLVTRNTLEVFKVFRGQLPAGPLSLLTQGGTLGLRREDVSGALQLLTGQQGIFFLEADPSQPGERRAYAGPQGFIRYDLADLTASEPFGRYASIGQALYEAVQAGAGTTYRTVAANSALTTATQRRSLRAAAGPLATAIPAISSFSPSAVTAGTSTANRSSADGVLTINGSGFNATQGTGYVEFRNADDGGATYIRPVAGAYLLWSDTQIQVQVPSASNTAGTGTVRVTNSDANTAASASPLTVTYALTSVSSSFTGTAQPYSVRLAGTSETDNVASNPTGYLLHYTTSTTAGTQVPAAARTSFETALASWHCQAGANRSLGADASPTAAAADGVNLVAFGSLSTGVLGVTNSYYQGCYVGSAVNWDLIETDYTFTNAAAINWYYGSGTPAPTDYDFQSVALHELGHGILLSHIISSTGVMNYSISNGQTKRTLDANTDLAAATSETTYSTAATMHCAAAYTGRTILTYSSSSCVLPVELVAFTARHVPGQGTLLSWGTALESNSAAFVVESQADPTTSAWQAVAQVAAASSSTSPRQYQARDMRPLAGTCYYRLRQVDLDGKVAYSPVVSVSATATELVAYPNPATGTVHLSGPLAPGSAAQVRLLDATGRCMASATGPAGRAAFDLPLASVPAGLYVLEWDGGAGRAHTRLVVQ